MKIASTFKQRLIFAFVLGLGLSSSSAFAQSKTVTCQVDDAETTVFKGKCVFTPQGNGSFYLSGKNLSQTMGIDGLMVYVEQTNVATVQATTLRGGASTWGQAIRSQHQRACWVGQDFKVCAW